MRTPEFFDALAQRYFANRFTTLKKHLSQAASGILFETYLARMIFYAFLASAAVLAYSVIMLLVLGLNPIAATVLAIITGAASGFAVFSVFYLYPSFQISSKRKSIETNLPFAANHMGALAASGIPPHTMFKLLTDATEYGEIANESRRIMRNIEIFGMDVLTSMRQVANRTPSPKFRQFLSGMVATITTGGDLRTHLQVAAKEALADYKLKRERYLESLSTYADFYVGVLIAAPLFFISILSLLSIIGGEIIGMPINVLLSLGIYVVLPVLNIAFLIFVHLTQPSV